jgi:hypothetical protein
VSVAWRAGLIGFALGLLTSAAVAWLFFHLDPFG